LPTLRALPGRGDNDLLAAYRAGLTRHWPMRRHLLARLLAGAGQGGWTPAERHLLSDAVRQRGLSMRDRKGLHRLLNPGAFPFATNPLKNKQLFAEVARAAGLTIAPACNPDRDDLAAWLAGERDIIAKPSFQSKGQGVERFWRDETWRGCAGPVGDDLLMARLLRVWRDGGVIQRRLPTHAALADLSPGALPTLRVMTCLDEDGVPEACGLALRLSAGGIRPVDNFNAGNLVLGVDAAGRCGPAWLGGGAGAPSVHAHHPKTGAPIEGFILSDLPAAIALALDAHHVFRTGFTVIGWDIGLTDAGPMLVEGNWNPGTDILQLVEGRGVADMRLGALYRHHLDQLPAQAWCAARAIEWDRRRA
jgi:hypothetical protein